MNHRLLYCSVDIYSLLIMLLEDDQMLSSKVKVGFLWATTVVHAIFSPHTVSTVHVWIGPRLLIARYCLLFSELFSNLLYTYYSQNYARIIYLALMVNLWREYSPTNIWGYISSNLSWDDHITDICLRAERQMGVLLWVCLYRGCLPITLKLFYIHL